MTLNKVSSHLAIRTMQNLLKNGWPNKRPPGMQRDFDIATRMFHNAEGRHMTVADVRSFVGIHGRPINIVTPD